MSNFILKSIEINNFRSIKHQVFEVKDGLFVVVGNNKDNPGNNNGAGKTSLISAFFWALTGTSLNGEVLADEVINLKTGKDCLVKCTFITDQGDLVITRTRKDSELGNSLSVVLNDQDISCHKIADTQDRINQIIKVPFELLKSTIIMTSDMKSRFSDLTTQGRINLLESIRDYSIWNRVREVSKTDINEIDKKIKVNADQVTTFKGSISTYDSLISSVKFEKNNLEEDFKNNDYNALITECKNQINELQVKHDALNNIDMSVLDSLNTKLTELNSKKDQLFLDSQNVVSKIHEEVTNANKAILEVQESNKELRDTKVIKKGNLELQLRSYQNDKKIINQWFVDDTCPTCHRKLERTEEEINNKNQELAQIDSEIVNLTAKIDTLDAEITGLKGYLDNCANTLQESARNEQEKVQEAQKSIKNEVESITNLIKSIENDKNAELDKINQQKSLQLEIKQQINDKNVELVKYESNLQQYNDKVTDLANKISTYESKIKELEGQITELEGTNKELNDTKELFNYYYQQLGPKGNLRPWLLAKDINYLNVCIKKYVHKFFEDTDVYLTKPTLEDNSINIIVDCGNGLVKPVSSLSGGERKRVDLCIQLALYDLVKSTSLFGINFVCFDEIESALDGAGIRCLIDIIEERQDIIPTILWISNRDEVIECIKDRIIVTKQNGFSEIKYE